MSRDDSATIDSLALCRNTQFLEYYERLHGNTYVNNQIERRLRFQSSNMPMIVYYRNFDFKDKCSIYQSYMPDYLRVIISRWRLSSHSLRIETDRYENILDRNDRVCKLCNMCEYERHVIFICPAYKELRHTYKKLLRTISVGSFFRP